jgi:hypothetical protein
LQFIADKVKTLDPERHAAQAESSTKHAAAAPGCPAGRVGGQKAGATAEVVHAAARILAELKATNTIWTNTELKTVERRLEAIEKANQKSCCAVIPG